MKEIAAGVLMLLIGLPGIAALVALLAVARGWVLSVLWGWFIVPGFGLPPLSIALAIGLSLLIGTLTNHRTFNEVEDPKKKWTPLWAGFFSPIVALLIGWVAKQYL